MTEVDPKTKRCRAATGPNPRTDVPHTCGNKTKDPSGRCWRHR